MNETIKKLEKLKDQYPTFAKMWVLYLEKREDSFKKSLFNCEKAIDLINKNKMDLTPEAVVLSLKVLTNFF